MINEICQLPHWEHYSIILITALAQMLLHEGIRYFIGKKKSVQIQNIDS
jgi:hypothetical protein